MSTTDLTTIAHTLTRLQMNYASLLNSWYDVFYNSTPMDVTLNMYDENGELIPVQIPNRAKDQSYFINGTVDPENNVIGNLGSVYTNTATGELFVKTLASGTSTGWSQLVSENQMSNMIRTGEGDPISKGLTGTVGQLYIDTLTGYMYMMRSSTGSDGWERIDSYPAVQLKRSFKITQDTTELNLDIDCPDVGVMNVYENGILVPHEQYYMVSGNKKTIYFKEPLLVPQEEKDKVGGVTITVMWFVDVHVAESSAMQTALERLKETRMYAYGVDYVDTPYSDLENPKSARQFYEEMSKRADEIEVKVDSIDEAKQEALSEISSKYSECRDLLQDDYNDMKTYAEATENNFMSYSKEIKDRADTLMEFVPKAEDIQKDVLAASAEAKQARDEVVAQKDDFASKAEQKAYEETLNNRVDTKFKDLDDTVKKQNDAIQDNYDTLNVRIMNETTNRNAQIESVNKNVKDYTDSMNSWFNAHTDLGNFDNNIKKYLTEESLPISTNDVYSYSKNTDATQAITVTIIKDCMNYEIDLGAYMEQEVGGAPVGNTDFSFTLVPDKGVIDNLLLQRLHSEGKALDMDNIVSVVRVHIKNNTEYVPFINWDYRKITWLGDEPELEAGKNYVIEFISYDMMGNWYAHPLGLCQAAIAVDTFSTSFTINCPGMTDEDIDGNGKEMLTVAMNIDGREVIADQKYEFDTTAGTLTVPMEIDRRFKNSEISKFYIRSDNMQEFYRYFASGLTETPLVLSEGRSYTVNCDTKALDEDHSFELTLRSLDIENYMKQEGLSVLVISAKFKFDFGSIDKDTVITGVYNYNASEPGSNGVTFSFGVDTGVLRDTLLGETEENKITNIKLRYAAMAENSCYQSIETITVVSDYQDNSIVSMSGTWEEDTATT